MIGDYEKMEFIDAWNDTADEIHQTCRDKGFWDDRERVEVVLPEKKYKYLDPKRSWQFVINEALMLVVTEISEAVEAVRHGNPPDDKVPQFSGLEAELADAVIRIMDLAAGYDLDVAGAIVAKAEYNKGRERLHGKTC